MVLLLMILIVLNLEKIRKISDNRKIQKNINAHIKTLEKLEEDRDFFEFYSYIDHNDLHWVDELEEYNMLSRSTGSYIWIYNKVMKLVYEQDDEYFNKERAINPIGLERIPINILLS